MPHGRKRAAAKDVVGTGHQPGADPVACIAVSTAPKRKRQSASDLLRKIRQSDEEWENFQDKCDVMHQVSLFVLLVHYAP